MLDLNLIITMPDGETHPYVARAVSGFHRPLNGEAANLTLTLDRSRGTDPDWFTPPLGADAEVSLENETLLTGVLTGVVMDRVSVQLSIEG